MTEREPADLLAELTWLRRLAHTLVGERGAEDLAQDVAVAAVESPPPEDRRRPWLAGVTRRLAARFHRDERRRTSREREAARPLAGEAEQQAVERVRVHRQLVDAVLGLPEPWRRAVIGRYFDARSPAQIARASGLTPGTVRQHLHRGLAELRRRLRDADGEAWRTRLAAAFPLGLFPSAIPALGVSLMAKKTALALTAAALLVSTWWLWPTAPERAPTTPADALAARAASKADEATGRMASAASATPSGAAAVERAAAGAPAPTFEVRVVDGAGSPCAETGVWIWTRAGEIEEFTTDADGKVSAPPREEAGGILVTRDRTARHELLLDALEGTHTVQLGDGTRLAGRVLVDGVPPEEPVTLELPVGLELPRFAYPAIEQAGTPLAATVQTDRRGTFTFEGLAASWTGRIELSEMCPCWFLDGGRGYELGAIRRHANVARARSDLELQVTRLPSISGRVVWPDGRGADATLGIQARFADGSEIMSSTRGLSVSKGRFDIGLLPRDLQAQARWLSPALREPIEQVTLTWNARGAIETSRTWTATDLPQDGDVGDLVLDAMPSLHFVVTDPSGDPVQGAVVEGAPPSKPTGADGRGEVHAREHGLRSFRVGAPGCQVEALPGVGTGTRADPLRFTVRKGNRLDIGMGEGPARGYATRIILTSRDPIFSASEGLIGVSRMHLASGTPDCGNCIHNAVSHTIEFRVSTDTGSLSLHSLAPGGQVTLTAVDGLSQTIAQRHIVAPAIGEVTSVTLGADTEPCVVHGVVRGPEGPVPGWHGSLGMESAGPLHLRGEADGTFEVRVAPSGEVGELRVAIPPFVEVRRPVRLAPGRVRVEVELVVGQTLDTIVIDSTGEPVPTFAPRLEMQGHAGASFNTEPLTAGRWRFHQLPIGAGRVVVQLGAHEFSQPVSLPSAEVRLEVPTPGTVRLRAPDAWQPGDANVLQVRVEALDIAGEPTGQHAPIAVWRGDAGWITATRAFVPGRYRALVRVPGVGQGAAGETPPPVEFEVLADTPVDVWIRPE